jgi:Ca2+-binding EF-hand superfamily protein
MTSNGFTIDKQEYQSVFKVFDKDNTGELTIQQVNSFIAKFEQIQTQSDLPSSIHNKLPGAKQGRLL